MKRKAILVFGFLLFTSSVQRPLESAFASPQAKAGAVYTMTNSADGNEVLVFDRSADGTLTPAGSYPTGGAGTGMGLGSQGAVILSKNNRWLFVVNAGSNSISVFQVHQDGLDFVGVYPSNGLHPISLTLHRNLLYVLHDGGMFGGMDSINGFRVGDPPASDNGGGDIQVLHGRMSAGEYPHSGHLTPIPDSTRYLSAANTSPAQIEFTPDGRVLVVTEKATNNIDTFKVGYDGIAEGPTVFASEGETPFGFAFGRRNLLFVTEAHGGAPDASSLSSYSVSPDGTLQVISSAVPTTETAACWAVVTPIISLYVYATNTGSGSVSGYQIDRQGSIALLDPDGRTGETGDGSGPLDVDFSEYSLSYPNSLFLYTLNGGNGTISAFRVIYDGSLKPLAGYAAQGLPPGSTGLAAH